MNRHELTDAQWVVIARYSPSKSLDEQGEMGVRTQALIGHQYVSWSKGGMHRLDLSGVVGQEGRDHELPEHPSAGMEQPQEVRHGNAAPLPLCC
jgi:hypothetical protein